MADNELFRSKNSEDFNKQSTDQLRLKREQAKKEEQSTMFFYTLSVYSPVILVLSLIVLIYTCYLAGYVYVLMSYPDEAVPDKIYPFYTRPSDKSASFRKGLALLIVTFYLLVIFMISFLRTVFMDPGFFDDVTKFEGAIIQKVSPFNRSTKWEYDEMRSSNNLPVSNVDEIFSRLNKDHFRNGPLTSLDFMYYYQIINSYYIERPIYLENNLETGHVAIPTMESVINDENKRVTSNFDDIWSNFKGVDLKQLNICHSCFRHKIERSHHCRQCGVCVLKMDHHCPWLANCIGFRNYKYFCLVHLYGCLLTGIVTLTFWEAVAGVAWSVTSSFFEIFIYLFAYITNVGLMAFLIWLFAANFRLVFTGQTVIEQSDRERFPSAKAINLYDLGYYNNFTTVFGTNPLLWFMPFNANYKGEGIIYEKKQQEADVLVKHPSVLQPAH